MASTFLRWPSSRRMHLPERRSHTLPHASRPLEAGREGGRDERRGGRKEGRNEGVKAGHY